MATAPNYNQAFDAPGYAALKDALEADILDLRQRLEAAEKVTGITQSVDTAPSAPTYSGNFTYNSKTYTFTRPAFFWKSTNGPLYIKSEDVKANPGAFAALLDDLIERESDVLLEVV